jgi:putative ATPase
VTLIGATTENPSFELNKALLSRTRVHVLKALLDQDLLKILDRALEDKIQGYGNFLINFSQDNKIKLIKLARQDARALLNLLELVIELSAGRIQDSPLHRVDSLPEINIEIDPLLKHLGENISSFDKQGDVFYDAISALHKSIRGSDPDASLYWLAKLLVGGVDGLYIARRLIRIASEDIGNADPRALQICINTWDVLERLGPGEGELALGQAVLFLSCAPKSNAGYLAFNQAMDLIKNSGSAEMEIPMHLRNSPTQLMTDLGYGKNYRYPHDEPHGYAAGETYFPEGVSHEFYKPSDRGLEKQIQERLNFLRKLTS